MPPSESVGANLAVRGPTPVYLVGGPPAPATALVVHMCMEMVRHVHGGLIALSANDFSEDLSAAFEQNENPVLLFFDLPDENISRFILANDFPLVLVEEAFDTAAAYCIVARNLTEIETVRFLTNSLACLGPLQWGKGIEPLLPRRVGTVEALVDDLAGRLRLPAERWASVRANVLAALIDCDDVNDAVRRFVYSAREAEASNFQLLPVVHRYIHNFTDHDGLGRTPENVRLTWPAKALNQCHEPYDAVDGAIDLTGPARALTIGPYLHLPPARYRAGFRFQTSDNFSGNMLMFDIMADSNVQVSISDRIFTAGDYLVQCDFIVTRPRCPVEFRSFLMEGAIEGSFTPLGVELHLTEKLSYLEDK